MAYLFSFNWLKNIIFSAYVIYHSLVSPFYSLDFSLAIA